MSTPVEVDRRTLDFVVGLDTELNELVEGSHLYTPTVRTGPWRVRTGPWGVRVGPRWGGQVFEGEIKPWMGIRRWIMRMVPG